MEIFQKFRFNRGEGIDHWRMAKNSQSYDQEYQSKISHLEYSTREDKRETDHHVSLFSIGKLSQPIDNQAENVFSFFLHYYHHSFFFFLSWRMIKANSFPRSIFFKGISFLQFPRMILLHLMNLFFRLFNVSV